MGSWHIVGSKSVGKRLEPMKAIKTKCKFVIRAVDHLFARAVCAAAYMMISSSVQAQNLFVVGGLEEGNNIYEITPGGVESTFASGLGEVEAEGLAFDSAGDLFVADRESGNIYEFTPDGAQTNFASGFDGLVGLAFNNAGDLFVANSFSIIEITPGGAQTTFASMLPMMTYFAFQPVPRLTIILSGTNVILTWPTNASGFTLESTTNLVSPAVWNTNMPSPIAVNGQNAVTNTISGGQMFYRLSQ
jgi:hypothetical protein